MEFQLGSNFGSIYDHNYWRCVDDAIIESEDPKEEEPKEEDPKEEDPKGGNFEEDSKDESSTNSNITP